MNDELVQIVNLKRTFGNTIALDAVDLQLPRGMVLGLVGANGAGKTTLIKHLLGLLKAQHGTVRVFGVDPVADPVSVLGRVGYLSEDRDLPDWMRIGDFLRYSRAFYPKWDERFAEQLMGQFQLDWRQKIRSLSRGQRARVGLLAALAHRPDLLILDEPSSGLDPIVRRDILSAIIRTVAEEGRSVLFSSHLLEEVQRVADAMALIHQGRIVLHDTVDAIVQAHHRIVVRLQQATSQAPRIPGALSWSGEGTVWTAIANGEVHQLRQAAEEVGARIIEEDTPTLDEIFVARVAG